MTTTNTVTGSCRQLVSSLLPKTWPSRAELLATADRLDAHLDDAAEAVLASWRSWRATGALPADANQRDLLAALGALLGGVASEMRYRPRELALP